MKHILSYTCPPADRHFVEVNSAELAEIIRKIRQAEPNQPSDTEWAYDAWASDLNAATLAAEQADGFGATVLVAQDEDGYYFATKDAVAAQ